MRQTYPPTSLIRISFPQLSVDIHLYSSYETVRSEYLGKKAIGKILYSTHNIINKQRRKVGNKNFSAWK